MAIKAILETNYGETRELYVRINNVEVSNHGVPAVALARGYVSKDAFDQKKSFVWERSIEFDPDVSKPIWEQAYSALMLEPDFSDAVDC